MDGRKKRGLIIVGLAAIIVAGSFWGHLRRAAAPEPPPGAPAGAKPAAVADSRPAVYVTGAVNSPGVYRVSPDGRVGDAISAAGGLAPEADAARVNLALAVRDGMQVHVPPAARAVGAAAKPAAGKVSINYADKDELETLPGIGPVLAERIVEYRQVHGCFRDIAELKRVKGIGDSKFNRIRDRITL